MSKTYITGYWKIKENIKHSYNHYKQLFEGTFNILKNQNVIFLRR